MENELENLDSPNQEEVAPESDEVGLPADEPEVEPKDEEAEDTEELKQRNQDLYEQLKKAKGFIRDKDGKWVKKETLQLPKKEVKISEDITRTELYSLVKANVPEEDTQEVITYAQSHGLDVTEALKRDEVKAILRVRKEFRTSADAANTAGTRRGPAKVSDETLLENARQGIYPSDAASLARARTAEQMKRLKGN